MKPIHGTEAEDQIDRSDKEIHFPVLTSGKISNPTEDDMDVLCCIGIKIDDNN